MVRLYFFEVSKDCNVGPVNFSINSNAQQIVRSIAVFEHEQTVKQESLEEFKTYLLFNVPSLQPTSSQWGSGITTRYIYIKETVLNGNQDDIFITVTEGDSSLVISEKRKRHRTNIPVKKWVLIY